MNPFTPTTLAELAHTHGTPLWVYDAATIERQVAALRPFDVIRFAQKANSNTHVLRLLKSLGVVVDAVSLGEVERALHAGFAPGLHNGHAEIVFTADLLDRTTLPRLVALGIPVNCGSIDMLDQLGQSAPLTLCGCASTPALATATATRPTPAVSTASTASGMGIWKPRWARYAATV